MSRGISTTTVDNLLFAKVTDPEQVTKMLGMKARKVIIIGKSQILSLNIFYHYLKMSIL